MPVAAIITGDIVNFTLSTPPLAKKMIVQLSSVLERHKFEFYRGDSFQVYVKDPSIALELILRLRSVAKNIHSLHDVRASIGIGQVDSPVRTLGAANSEAFILSGRAFDELGKEQRLLIRCNDPKANIALDVIAYFADFILQQVTSSQAEVLLQLLNDQTQAQAAKKLKKAQATVNQLAKSGGWPQLQQLIDEYKRVITQFDLL
jgi:hypothetical protein